MRLASLALLVSSLAACNATRAVPGNAIDPRPGVGREIGSFTSAEASSSGGPTIVLSFPEGGIEQALDDWNDSQKRLRFSRGCILLVGPGDDQADGARALMTGTYPLGDAQDIDLAVIELSRASGTSELRVSSRGDSVGGVERVIQWLESLGGVVVESLGRE